MPGKVGEKRSRSQAVEDSPRSLLRKKVIKINTIFNCSGWGKAREEEEQTQLEVK